MAASVGTVSTVAGSAEKGFEDGRGINAKFNSPLGLAFSKDGGILIADYMNHCIRKVVLAGSAPAHVETFAGIPGQYGHRDGDASQALFHFPSSIAVASDGTVYVADPGNKRTRKVSTSLGISTSCRSTQRPVNCLMSRDLLLLQPYDVLSKRVQTVTSLSVAP